MLLSQGHREGIVTVNSQHLDCFELGRPQLRTNRYIARWTPISDWLSDMLGHGARQARHWNHRRTPIDGHSARGSKQCLSCLRTPSSPPSRDSHRSGSVAWVNPLKVSASQRAGPRPTCELSYATVCGLSPRSGYKSDLLLTRSWQPTYRPAASPDPRLSEHGWIPPFPRQVPDIRHADHDEYRDPRLLGY